MKGASLQTRKGDPVSRLRISIVTETFPPEVNGVSATVGRITSSLLKSGHQIQLIRPRQSRNDSGGERIDGEQMTTTLVAGIPIPGYSWLRFGYPSGKRVKRLWQMQRPDIIYIATQGPLGWSAVKQANLLGIPTVSSFHTNFHSYFCQNNLGFLKRKVSSYLRALHNRTKCTLVATGDMLVDLQQGGIENIKILGNGVDNSLFSPAKRDHKLRRSWGVWPDEPVVLYVGRLAADKNLPLAVHAFRAMQKKNPNLRFVIVGEGPLYENLYSIDRDLIFTGALHGEELARHYASADIFLFPSENETFGNVTLEAMASGLAVVAYDHAAAHLHIEDGKSGLLVEHGNSAAFIERALKLTEDPRQIESLGTHACQYAQQHEWERIAQLFEQLLQLFSNGVDHVHSE